MNAVITGATKGIGRAIAIALAADGYNLLLAARSADDLTQLQLQIKQKKPLCKVFVYAGDLAEAKNVQALGDAVKKNFATVDVLIHNVGGFQHGYMMEEAFDSLEKMMQLNVYSAYYLTKSVYPLLKAADLAHVFFMCSSVSDAPRRGSGSYSVSKYALLGLASNTREEFRYEGIKVTAILPGSTFSDSWKGSDLAQEKFVQPEDVAKIVVSAINMSPNAVLDEIRINPIAEVFDRKWTDEHAMNENKQQ
jgi:short-subunit dehydrogenase